MAGVVSFIALAMATIAVFAQNQTDPTVSSNDVTFSSTTTRQPTTTKPPLTTTPRPKPPAVCKYSETELGRFLLRGDEVYEYFNSNVETYNILTKFRIVQNGPFATVTRKMREAGQKYKRLHERPPVFWDPVFYGVYGVYTQLPPLWIPFILGLLGNGLVLFTIFSYLKTKTVTNILLAALAVTDLLTLLVSVPVKTYDILRPNHIPLGPILCPGVFFVQWLFYHASIYTLVLIALERFLTICFPLKSKLISTPGTIKRLLVVVWLIAFGMAVPASLYYKESNMQDKSKDNFCLANYMCGDWSGAAGRVEPTIRAVAMYFVGINFFLPLICMSVAYGVVSVVLIKSIRASREMKQSSGQDDGKKVDDDADAKKRFKIVKMLIMIVVLFAICWCPYVIVQVMQMSYKESILFVLIRTDPSMFVTVRNATYGLAYANSCVNPLVYLCMSKSFRDGFLYAIGCKKGRGPDATSRGTATSRLSSSTGGSTATY